MSAIVISNYSPCPLCCIHDLLPTYPRLYCECSVCSEHYRFVLDGTCVRSSVRTSFSEFRVLSFVSDLRILRSYVISKYANSGLIVIVDFSDMRVISKYRSQGLTRTLDAPTLTDTPAPALSRHCDFGWLHAVIWPVVTVASGVVLQDDSVEYVKFKAP